MQRDGVMNAHLYSVETSNKGLVGTVIYLASESVNGVFDVLQDPTQQAPEPFEQKYNYVALGKYPFTDQRWNSYVGFAVQKSAIYTALEVG